MTDWDKALRDHNKCVSNIERNKILHGWKSRLEVYQHVKAHIDQGYTLEQILWNCNANIKLLEEALKKEDEVQSDP